MLAEETVRWLRSMVVASMENMTNDTGSGETSVQPEKFGGSQAPLVLQSLVTSNVGLEGRGRERER